MSLLDIGSLIGLAGTGAAALKTGTEIAQNVQGIIAGKNPDLLALKQQISDLYDELIVAKKAQMAQQEALVELQHNLKKSDAFQAQKSNYALTKTDLGGFVYTLKLDKAGGDPPHDLCVSCFDQEKKSVLQPVGRNKLGCPSCKAEVFKSDGRGSGIMVGSVRHPGLDGF